MAKSSKKSKEAVAPDSGPTAPDGAAASTPGADKPVKPAVSKASAPKPAKATERPKTAGKRASRVADKTTTARKPRAATAGRKTRRARHVVISDDDIRLRAYFIAERRLQSGLLGDSAHDWLEARRQLQREVGKGA